MEQLLEQHFAGQGLRDLAAERGCSHETVAKEIRAAKREHILKISGELLLARRSGEVLWLLLPAQSGAAFTAGLQYLSWVVQELEELATPTTMSVKMLADGSIAFGLEERVVAQGG